ncbi:hypothetical protein I4U23_007775 [Adineta vaga]|nr:hypothetical protein I4U23_007775 [Adineta vaga]
MNGADRFFVTTVRRKLHIISFTGIEQTIELDNDGQCIAVGDGSRDIQIISY